MTNEERNESNKQLEFILIKLTFNFIQILKSSLTKSGSGSKSGGKS